jgi:putative ABC transport system permease protein
MFFRGPLQLGFAQAAVAALAAIMVALLARSRNIHLESDLALALLRGAVQIVAVGSILVVLLRSPRWTGGLLLAAMIIAAGSISRKRAKSLPGAFKVSTYAIACGAGSVIAITNGLTLNRFRADVIAHTGEIETALALGAAPKQSVAPYSQASFEASLIPAIDSLRSLGIVWIPGVMAGMLLSGASPFYAAIYQFVVVAMIFTASGLTSLVSTVLIQTHAFTPAEQLIIRPGLGIR